MDKQKNAAPVVAEGLDFATFEDWLASPINPPTGNGLQATMIEYARLAFNAARAAHPVAGSPAIDQITKERDEWRALAKEQIAKVAELTGTMGTMVIEKLGGEPMPASEAVYGYAVEVRGSEDHRWWFSHFERKATPDLIEGRRELALYTRPTVAAAPVPASEAASVRSLMTAVRNAYIGQTGEHLDGAIAEEIAKAILAAPAAPKEPS